MGVLTRIGELIKAFSMPQQESEWQDEDINPNKLATIAQQAGMKKEDIEELQKGYQKQASSAEKFRREQAEAVQQVEEKNKKRQTKTQIEEKDKPEKVQASEEKEQGREPEL